MENETFRERNRRRREENAFENLYAYAREIQIPDAEKVAERTAQQIHSGHSETRRRSSGRSNKETAKVPHRLEDRTKEQLYARAQELDIEGRSQMNKDELISAIRDQN